MSFDTLLSNASDIGSRSNVLDTEADLLIYGCDLASTQDGENLVNALANLTGAGEYVTTNAYAQLLDGDRHHVAVSWDSSNRAVAVYVDGALEKSTTGYKTGSSIGSGGVLVLGQDKDLGGTMESDQAFQGTYYDTRLWNTVRNATEIANNYQHNLDSGNVPANLIANWQLSRHSPTLNPPSPCRFRLDAGTNAAIIILA